MQTTCKPYFLLFKTIGYKLITIEWEWEINYTSKIISNSVCTNHKKQFLFHLYLEFLIFYPFPVKVDYLNNRNFCLLHEEKCLQTNFVFHRILLNFYQIQYFCPSFYLLLSSHSVLDKLHYCLILLVHMLLLMQLFVFH